MLVAKLADAIGLGPISVRSASSSLVKHTNKPTIYVTKILEMSEVIIMIDKCGMTVLVSAETAKSQADLALAAQEEKTIAYSINNAANTGEYSVKINQEISSELQQTLVTQGYTVSPVKDAYGVDVPGQYIIRWD